MNVREAAAKLEVSLSLCYLLIAEGRLRCHRIGRRGSRGAIRIAEDDLKRFLEETKPENAK